MKLHTLTDLEAAHDIDDGFEYVKNNPVLLNYSAAQGIIDTLSAGLSTGAVLANFPAAQPSRNVEKIRIKNNSLCILCPEYTRASANPQGEARFSRTPGVLFPGDEGEFEFSYRPTAYGINNGNAVFHLSFLVISADVNFTGLESYPSIHEIPMLRINFYSHRFSKLFIWDVTVNNETLEPVYASGLDPRGNDNVMTYMTYRGTENSREPSFGMAYNDVRAATINERNATGSTTLVFTPSAKRSGDPVRQLDNPGTGVWSEAAIRNFLRVCLHKYRAKTQVQTKSFAAISSLIGLLSTAKDIYSSISTRTDSRTYLTVSMKNLTGKNMFILRRKYSNSMRMDNGIVLDGETAVIPLAFSSFRPAEPELFIRIVEGNGEAIDLVLYFSDYGAGNSIKVSRVMQSGPALIQRDPAYSTTGSATNCVYSFVSPTRKHRVFIQPTIVTSHDSPTLDISLVMVENRPEFTPLGEQIPGNELPPPVEDGGGAQIPDPIFPQPRFAD